MEKFICKHPWSHFEINNPNGDVTMCCNNNTVLGNVNQNTVMDIWNGEKLMSKDRQKETIRTYNKLTQEGGALHISDTEVNSINTQFDDDLKKTQAKMKIMIENILDIKFKVIQ